MKKLLLAIAILVGGSLFAAAQVLTIDSSGNVITPTGSVSSTGFNASGGGAGRLSLATGVDQQPLPDAFELLAPLGMTTMYQEIAPLTSGAGLWRSNWDPAIFTSGVSGGAISYNVTYGGTTYSEAPPVG